MSVFHKNAWLLVLLCAVTFFSTTVAAQEEGAPAGVGNAAERGGAARAAKPGVPQTAQQRSGEAYFQQNCTLCHVYSGQKRSIGIQAPTQLIGLFKDPAIDEAGVRQLLNQGVPGKMPSFKYNFEPNQIDDLVAYLKIR